MLYICCMHDDTVAFHCSCMYWYVHRISIDSTTICRETCTHGTGMADKDRTNGKKGRRGGRRRRRRRCALTTVRRDMATAASRGHAYMQRAAIYTSHVSTHLAVAPVPRPSPPCTVFLFPFFVWRNSFSFCFCERHLPWFLPPSKKKPCFR